MTRQKVKSSHPILSMAIANWHRFQAHACVAIFCPSTSGVYRWFDLELISHGIVFFSHNKSVSAELISSETNQLTVCMMMVSIFSANLAGYNGVTVPLLW